MAQVDETCTIMTEDRIRIKLLHEDVDITITRSMARKLFEELKHNIQRWDSEIEGSDPVKITKEEILPSEINKGYQESEIEKKHREFLRQYEPFRVTSIFTNQLIQKYGGTN